MGRPDEQAADSSSSAKDEKHDNSSKILIPPPPDKPQSTPKERAVTITVAPTAPLITPRKEGYAPNVPSPLRDAGSTGFDEEDQLDGTQRRNLHITIVDVEGLENIQVTRTDSNDNESRFGMASIRTNRSTTPLLGKIASSPVLSLQSVGQDFSRYPTRDLSIESSSPLPSNSSIPAALPVGREEPANDFSVDIDEIERGFFTHVAGRGNPAIYPSLHEREDDDDLHAPESGDNSPPQLKQLCRQPRFLLVAISGCLFIVGLLTVFIVVPILTYAQNLRAEEINTKDQLPGHSFPILGAIRTDLIDPDTPTYAMTRKSVLGQGDLKLVFSDEFNTDGRTFYEGEDQFWQAGDIHYAATNDLEWYDPDAITTANGTLQLRLTALKNHGLNFRSGMLQSWNKLCFKGGVLEVSASLAGPAGVPGLWPGIWTLGNLARPGYKATSDGVWPYAYDFCDVGITPNQSSHDGISYLPGQRLSSCTCQGEDHPNRGVGRGAPEIDALEGTSEYNMRVGVITQSSQVAPFDVWYQTNYDFVTIENHNITQMNSWMGGIFQQAISAVTVLNNDWYDGKAYQKYAYEYIPGQEDGMIAWFVGDDETFRMSGKAIGPNGNIQQRDISREPMSIILNLGLSEAWTWIDWASLGPRLAEGIVMYIDYVRIYQREGEDMITCDPPHYPTTQYISRHSEAYKNPNLTTWDQTGYPWPKNSLMHNCNN